MIGALRRLASTRVQIGLLAAAAACLALALANPVVSLPRRNYEFLVVLDITQSMNTPDVAGAEGPLSRLAGAKGMVDAALRRLPCGTRVGLGVFTAYRSFVLLAPVEVCASFQELRASLAHIDGRMAWAGGSEVAKGLHFGLKAARELPGKPALVLLTDGHEAPPVNPRHRPPIEVTPGEQQGLIAGVGGPVPQPIPKLDPDGKPRGYWRPDEVVHTDPYSQGRGGSVPGEALAEGEAEGPVDPALRRAGNEHLSALQADYLRLLARETGLDYVHARDARTFYQALTAPTLARTAPTPTPLQGPCTLAALTCLALAWLGTLRPAPPTRNPARQRPRTPNTATPSPAPTPPGK